LLSYNPLFHVVYFDSHTYPSRGAARGAGNTLINWAEDPAIATDDKVSIIDACQVFLTAEALRDRDSAIPDSLPGLFGSYQWKSETW
jgi:hypothetical protein